MNEQVNCLSSGEKLHQEQKNQNSMTTKNNSFVQILINSVKLTVKGCKHAHEQFWRSKT